MENKIIRSVCLFSEIFEPDVIEKIEKVATILLQNNFIIQTKRLCIARKNISELENIAIDPSYLLSVGTLTLEEATEQFQNFISSRVNCNIDLTAKNIEQKHADFLFDIVSQNAAKTFDFTFIFNSPPSSPYFPSANYQKNGFSIGLQPTDLSQGCSTIEEWLERMERTWKELNNLFANDPDFLGIDSSIAPLFEAKSSLIHFIKQLNMTFAESVTTDTYVTITKFLKEYNPKPVGLCGLMFPCLEDFELAHEYENGEFSIERNIYLSLHSGLGIDTYPIGVNEQKERVVEILKLIQALSNKYTKPLSCRFVSDGKANIGEKTDFKNQYLKDIVIKPL